MTVTTEFKQTKVGSIPSDWEVVKIGDVSAVNGSSLTNSTEPTYEFHYIDLSAVKEGHVEIPTEKISFSTSPSRARRTLETSDVLMATVRPNLKGFGLVNFDPKDKICSTGFAVIRANNGISNPEYLYQNLYSKHITSQIEALVVGSNYPAINSTDVEHLSIPLPPLQEQKKIAEVLSTVDDKIDSIEQEIEQTKILKKGLMQKLLTGQLSVTGKPHTFKDSKLGQIPETWEVVKLEDRVSKVGSGITPRGGSEAYVESGVMFIRSQNVLAGRLKYENIAFITDEQHDKMSGTKLLSGDVLLNITGASIGRSAVVPNDFTEGNVNQHVCIIRTADKLNSIYLCQLLNSSYGQNLIFRCQAGGNREGLNFQQIKSFGLMLPPLPEQERIAEILGGVDSKRDVLVEKKNQYATLKKGLMQKLLTGKLRMEV